MSSYMIGRNGEQFGPYSEEELRAHLGNGQVLPDDLAWTEGMADWVPVSQIFPTGAKNSVAPPPPAYGQSGRGAAFWAAIWTVIIIVGIILLAIAIPAYQDYSVRVKMSEVLVVGAQATVAVAEFIETKNAIPTQMEQTGFSANSPYVKRVAVNGQNGAILLTIGFSPLTDKTIALVPSRDQDKGIVWKCVSEDVPPKYLPATCR